MESFDVANKNKNMNDHAKCKIGIFSLWSSILGFVVPIVIALLVTSFLEDDPRPYYEMCHLLFAGVQFVALVTGIIGRYSTSGKSGLIISAVFIVVAAVIFLLPKEIPQGAQSPDLETMEIEFQQDAAGATYRIVNPEMTATTVYELLPGGQKRLEAILESKPTHDDRAKADMLELSVMDWKGRKYAIREDEIVFLGENRTTIWHVKGIREKLIGESKKLREEAR